MNKIRCRWVDLKNELYVNYHDIEWGVPLYDEGKLFEFINLEGMQAGLSWITILKKREHYRACFSDFDAQKIINFTPKKLEKILLNPGIIRNRRKVEAIVANAHAFLSVKEQLGSFSNYIWGFVNGMPINNQWKNEKKIPVTTKISDLMAKDLKKRGFRFVGSTTCYAFMQAVGMVNDHLVDCFRYQQILRISSVSMNEPLPAQDKHPYKDKAI